MKFLLALLVTASLYGHPGAPSLWTIQAGPNGISSRIVVPLPSLSGKREADANLLSHFVLRTRNGAAPAGVTSVRQRNPDEVEFLVRYELPLPPEFEIESTFFELADPGHGTVCRLDLGGHVESFVLDVNNPARRIETGAGPRIPFRKQLEWMLEGLFVLLFTRLALQRGSLRSLVPVFAALLSCAPGRSLSFKTAADNGPEIEPAITSAALGNPNATLFLLDQFCPNSRRKTRDLC